MSPIRRMPVETGTTGLMSRYVVGSASIYSTTRRTIITNSDGLSKILANTQREICLVAMMIPVRIRLREITSFVAV
jgi:hypothetical protein